MFWIRDETDGVNMDVLHVSVLVDLGFDSVGLVFRIRRDGLRRQSSSLGNGSLGGSG